MQLKVKGFQTVTVNNLKEAQNAYKAYRDSPNPKSLRCGGRTASEMPYGFVYEGNEQIAQISYNGRIWTIGGKTEILP